MHVSFLLHRKIVKGLKMPLTPFAKGVKASITYNFTIFLVFFYFFLKKCKKLVDFRTLGEIKSAKIALFVIFMVQNSRL